MGTEHGYQLKWQAHLFSSPTKGGEFTEIKGMSNISALQISYKLGVSLMLKRGCTKVSSEVSW